MHWRWGLTPDLLHQRLHSKHPTCGTEFQQLDPLPPSEAPSKAQIRFRCSQSPVEDWLVLSTELGDNRWLIQPAGMWRLREVTFPYDIWFSELLSHSLVPTDVFIVLEKSIWTSEKEFSFLKAGDHCTLIQNSVTSIEILTPGSTYIHNRFLEFDVEPVVGKGNDGILCSSHILCALPMELNEGHLQKGSKTLISETISQKSATPAAQEIKQGLLRIQPHYCC